MLVTCQASWDEPTQTVVMHRGAEPSLLQSLALQLADKVRNNENRQHTAQALTYLE